MRRSLKLADELGIESSKRYWNWIYRKRSQVVHGAESRLIAPAGWYESDDEPLADVAKIAKAQDVLRGAIRRAIEDDEFRAVFEDSAAIRLRWPIE